MYYFDNCATTPVKPEVLDLLNQINNEIYGNDSSIYSSGKKSRALIEKARYQVANSIKADPEQIIFTSGGTEANNQVLWSLLVKDNAHVISNQIEQFSDCREVPLHFIGSIGFYLKEELAEVLESKKMNIGKVLRKPIDGLVNYHLENI